MDQIIKQAWSVKPSKGSSCKTLKIEDLIISPNTEMTEIYEWFGVHVDPEATGKVERVFPIYLVRISAFF